MEEKIAVVGLGYVGLPVALAMGKRFDTVGFDIREERVNALIRGYDETGEQDLTGIFVRFTSNPKLLEDRTFIIVAVPTPIDGQNRPDLTPLKEASKTISQYLKPGVVVVYESTVYPGVTEDVCGPILAEGVLPRTLFSLGYSPERINPGDREHTFESITKVVAGEDEATLERIARVYSAVVPAGVYKAPSIRVAEAAKVIENTQRDLNIALMNELAFIFDRMGIRTADVLAAAGTKWNFIPFTPGLVGGHCIGVDPYYLTSKAEALGYLPEVILTGRRVNNQVGAFIASKVMKLLVKHGIPTNTARIGILGLTFKEDVPDLRNSKVWDIVNELKEYGIKPLIHDPMVTVEGASSWIDLHGLDVLVYAVPHQYYESLDLLKLVNPGGLVIDVKSRLDPVAVKDKGLNYWSL